MKKRYMSLSKTFSYIQQLMSHAKCQMGQLHVHFTWQVLNS